MINNWDEHSCDCDHSTCTHSLEEECTHCDYCQECVAFTNSDENCEQCEVTLAVQEAEETGGFAGSFNGGCPNGEMEEMFDKLADVFREYCGDNFYFRYDVGD